MSSSPTDGAFSNLGLPSWSPFGPISEATWVSVMGELHVHRAAGMVSASPSSVTPLTTLSLSLLTYEMRGSLPVCLIRTKNQDWRWESAVR